MNNNSGCEKIKMAREAVGMTPTEFGEVIYGYRGKQAYDMISAWENGTKKPSRPVERVADIVIVLAIARDVKTPGAGRALNVLIDMLRKEEDEDNE